jgi:hypothetical protein
MTDRNPEVDYLSRTPFDDQEERSWDGEIGRLRAEDEALDGLQSQFVRIGSDILIWQLSDQQRSRLLRLLEETQSYPQAVARFLDETVAVVVTGELGQDVDG